MVFSLSITCVVLISSLYLNGLGGPEINRFRVNLDKIFQQAFQENTFRFRDVVRSRYPEFRTWGSPWSLPVNKSKSAVGYSIVGAVKEYSLEAEELIITRYNGQK